MVSRSRAPHSIIRRRDHFLPHRHRLASIRKGLEGKTQHDAWQTIQRSHAIANGCFVAAVNRIGHEAPVGGEGIEFWGQSFVTAPSGEVIAEAAADQPETLLVQADLAQVHEARTHWPFLRDRRIDAYTGLTERFLD